MRFLDSYTERSRSKAYLLRIALNVCRDYHRRNRRQDPSYEELAEQTGAPAARQRSGHEMDSVSCPSPESQVEMKQLVRAGTAG